MTTEAALYTRNASFGQSSCKQDFRSRALSRIDPDLISAGFCREISDQVAAAIPSLLFATAPRVPNATRSLNKIKLIGRAGRAELRNRDIETSSGLPKRLPPPEHRGWEQYL
jgi:hypothetical protein